MKFKLYRILFFIIAFAVISCSKNAPSPTKSNTNTNAYSDADVYLAGSSKSPSGDNVATYWKNGSPTVLRTPNNTPGTAQVITINGNDIFVGGCLGSLGRYGGACYWKNGAFNGFGSSNSGVLAIAVSNGDVYPAGMADNLAAVWKNVTLLPIWSPPYSIANAVAINGSDIYAAGFTTVTNNYAVAVYWKNGIVTKLSSETANANANSIAVNGADVYVAGYTLDANNNPTAVLWKNGVATTLSSLKSMASIVAINGNDVFIVGYDSDKPVYWKNGQEKDLPLNAQLVFVSAIAFKGSDIYIGGYTSTGPILWKNQTATQFTKPDNILYPENVLVVPH